MHNLFTFTFLKTQNIFLRKGGISVRTKRITPITLLIVLRLIKNFPSKQDGIIKRSMASRAREGILQVYSALVRRPQQSCVQLWSPQHRTDMDPLERGQRRPQQ